MTIHSRSIAIVCTLMLCTGAAVGEPVKHQVTGLFMPEREQDLRELVATLPEIKLISIDYKNAEAVFDYDVQKFGKPEQTIQKLDAMIRTASRGAFGVKPLSKTPADKLKLIEIAVAGCDCKACSLAAYESIYRLDGVERATASFRVGRVTALVDATKIDRPALEAALKKKGVHVKTP
jgi:hypothetical protein